MNTNNHEKSRISKKSIQSFEKQNDLSRKVMIENRAAGKHSLEYYDDLFEIDSDVFSPKIFYDGFNTFLNGLKKQSLENKTFLEIGTGCGIVPLHLLKHANLKRVMMTDIFDIAIDCARKNAIRLALQQKCKFIISDVFDSINITEDKFNVIFWNYPWLPEKDSYEYKDKLDRSLFDPGYKTIERYISESKHYISENGRVFFGFGDYGYWDLLKKICLKYSVAPVVVYEEVGKEGDIVKYQLVELKSI
jgi:methylase of polypeptide subunit release factors